MINLTRPQKAKSRKRIAARKTKQNCASRADQIIGRGLLSDMSQDKWGQLYDGNEMELNEI